MIESSLYAPIHPDGPWAVPGLSITGGDSGYGVPNAILKPMWGIDPDETNRPSSRSYRMRGVYTLTWDATGFTLPPDITSPGGFEEAQGVVVRTHLYVRTQDRSVVVWTHARCGGRVRVPTLTRATHEPVLSWTGGLVQTLSVPNALLVFAVRGEVRCFGPAATQWDTSLSVVDAKEELDGHVLIESP